MVSSLGVSIGSLLCSIVQIGYIAAILWMLRLRQRRIRQSLAAFPAAADAAQADAGAEPPSRKSKAGAGTAALTAATMGSPASGPDVLSLTHKSYYSNFLPMSFHSLPPARDEQLGAASAASFQTLSTPLLQSDDAPLSTLVSPVAPDSLLNAGLSTSAGTSGQTVRRGPAGATPAAHAPLRPADSTAAAGAAAVDAQLYDEEDPFQTRAAGEAAAAAAVRAAREAALAVSLHVAASNSANSSGTRASFSASSSSSTSVSLVDPADSALEQQQQRQQQWEEDEATEAEDEDGEVVVRAATASHPASRVASGASPSPAFLAPSPGSFSNPLSRSLSPPELRLRNGVDSAASDMTVSLDCDDLTMPSTLVDVVVDAPVEEEEPPRRGGWRRGFGVGAGARSGGGGGGRSRGGLGEGDHVRSTQLSSVHIGMVDSPSSSLRGVGGGQSASPPAHVHVRSDPTSVQASGHHVLHVLPAPFSQPERGEAHDSYSLLGDSPVGSGGAHRSRHIAHPKSLSYRPGGGGGGGSLLLRGGGGGGGGAVAAEESDDGAFGPRAAAIAVAKRREALARKNGFYRGGGGGGVAIPPPRPSAAAGAAPNSFALRQLDPNASPVRARVKFADSPRDRDRALLAATTETTISSTTSTAAARAGAGGSSAPPQQQQPVLGFASAGAGAASSPGDATLAATTGPSPSTSSRRKSSLLKRPAATEPSPGPAPAAAASAPSWSLLVLPVYQRLLLLQVAHCVLWAGASLVLLGLGTNLVEWGTELGHGHASGQPDDDPGAGAGDEGAVGAPGSSRPSWLFSATLALLMGTQAAVLDGLLVFLSARNVGRGYVRFSAYFSAGWGVASAVVVLVVSQTGGRNPGEGEGEGEAYHGALHPSHPFFVRSCMALILNLFVLLAPRCCVCDGRARRSNRGQKSQAELAAALERRQRRWDTYADESDTFDSDPDLYADGTEPRRTWLFLALGNTIFHSAVLAAFALDFARVDAGHEGRAWEWAALALLALGFVAQTPVLYACLLADSKHWQSEWVAALTRMKAEVAAEEAERQARRERALADLRARGLEAEARAVEAAAAEASSSSLADFEGQDGGFFIPPAALKYGALLGSGGFSSVYAARLGGGGGGGKGGQDVAVKVLHVRDLCKEVVELFAHEVSIVLRLRHTNVVRFLGVVFSPPDMVLVMERCRPHSLLELIRERKVHFTEFQAVSVGLAIADGLRYIHERDIVHRDLKSANILFDTAGRPKICDFGLSQQRSKIDLAHVFAGTLAYMSPETLRSENVGKYSDVYSFAIVLWELLHNRLAWKRGKGRGINARLLVEMVAYKRARPPLKERKVEAEMAANATGSSALSGVQSQQQQQAQARPPLAVDAARIDAQAFAALEPDAHTAGGGSAAGAAAAADPSASDAEVVGIHPALVQLLREMWRDDYLRRPNFSQIVKRLSAWREEMRAIRRAKAAARAGTAQGAATGASEARSS